tara:strand:+ start:5266 stop:5568 length:303 start_codon:yes stop_codon:yes gene_type:complete
MTPEGRVKEKVKKLLRSYGVYWHMPVQNGMGAPSLDFICCAKGWYLAIETKAPGGVPTPRQMATCKQITDAEGLAIVVRDEHDLAALETTLNLKGCKRAV